MPRPPYSSGMAIPNSPSWRRNGIRFASGSYPTPISRPRAAAISQVPIQAYSSGTVPAKSGPTM